jgi:hypothetical protein
MVASTVSLMCDGRYVHRHEAKDVGYDQAVDPDGQGGSGRYLRMPVGPDKNNASSGEWKWHHGSR